MIVAAGVMIVAPCPVSGVDTTLFLLRGQGGDRPNTWCFPGGRVEDGESVAAGAVRETEEECGLVIDAKDLGEPLTRSVTKNNEPSPTEPAEVAVPASASVDFTTFVHRVDRQFTPVLCDEHVGHCWAPLALPPAPTHPGCQVALERSTMDELGVARSMSEGRLVSPQIYENMALFAIRITATGAAYRTSLGEFVWRDKEIYLNEDFLARCAGLPVIWEHPEGSTLNSKEYSDRVIGAVMFAYIQGEDVWAIARIYDAASAKAMADKQISTSPAVVFFKDNPGNERATLEDGSKVLIEGKPDVLDHIAICATGVWDKGGEPTGVDRTAATAPGEMAVADAENDWEAAFDAQFNEGDHPRASDGKFGSGGVSQGTRKAMEGTTELRFKDPPKFVQTFAREFNTGAKRDAKMKTISSETLKKAHAALVGHIDPSSKDFRDRVVAEAKRRNLALTDSDLALADGVVRTLQRADFRGRALSLRARSLGLRARN